MKDRQHNKKHPPDEELRSTLARLNGLLEKLPDDYPYVFLFWRSIWFSFLRGIASGLGWIVAFALLLPILVILLRGAAFAPFIGNIIDAIAERIVEMQTDGIR